MEARGARRARGPEAVDGTARDDQGRDVVPVLLGLLRRIDDRTADLERRFDAQGQALDRLLRREATRDATPATPAARGAEPTAVAVAVADALRLDRRFAELRELLADLPAPATAAQAPAPAPDEGPPRWALDLTDAVDATTAEIERIGAALEALVGGPGSDGAPAPGALERRQAELESALRSFGEGVARSLDDLRRSVDALAAELRPAGEARLARIAEAEARLERLAAQRAALAARLDAGGGAG